MSSTTYTLEMLAELESAIAKGIFSVKYQDKTVVYRSLNEMLKLRDHMRRCLGLVQGSSRVLAEHCKGTK